MRRHIRILISLLFLALGLPIHSQEADPMEIVVVGKQPGPPLWRVEQGDHVLWIFPYLSPIPRRMEWDTARVSQVLAESQHFIGMPDVDLSYSKLMLLNPLNVVRGMRLAKRLRANQAGDTLAEVTPPELYERFAALKTAYFPRDRNIEKQRPIVAARNMVNTIHKQEGLGPGRDVLKTVERLARRNRAMTRSEVQVDYRLEGSFKELSARVEALSAGITLEQELACLERQIWTMETDLEDRKIRANGWAQGYIEEFRYMALPTDEDDACFQLVMASAEFATYEMLVEQLYEQWFEVAETALHTHRSSFAVLHINELLRQDGVLSRLRQKGYVIREP
jgi:hypothetical protein